MLTLYRYNGNDIRIAVTACFKQGDLWIEGHDSGRKVEELRGSSHYEYTITIAKEQLPGFYSGLLIAPASEKDALEQLALLFQGNTCFSDMLACLKTNQIQFQFFAWP